MAEATRKKNDFNVFYDAILPVLAFASSASSPQGAAGTQGLLSALQAGERRRGSKRRDQRFQDALGLRQQELDFKRQQSQPGVDLANAQSQFQLANLQDVFRQVNQPGPAADAAQALGAPQTERLQQALNRGEQAPLPQEDPTSQARSQRLGTLANTPGGRAQLQAAGLGSVARSGRDPQFAKDRRDLMLSMDGLPSEQFSPEQKRQLKQGIARASTQDQLIDIMAEVPIGLGAVKGGPDEQAYRALAATHGPIEAFRQLQALKRRTGEYGFGNQVDAALFSRFGEELQGSEPDPEMVEQAMQDVQDQKVQISREKGAVAGERQASVMMAKLKAQQQFEGNQTLEQARGEKSRQYFFKDNAQSVPQDLLMKDIRKGMPDEIVRVNAAEAKALGAFRNIAPLIENVKEGLQKLYGSGGIFESLEPGIVNRALAGGESAIAQLTQTNPELTTTIRSMQANVDLIRRQLQGQVGVQTERDAERGLMSLPRMTGIPDTKEVAFGTFNDLLTVINGSAGNILNNPGFTLPGLNPMGTQQQPVPGVREDTGPQATIRQQLKATGMSDEEINKAIGRTP